MKCEDAQRIMHTSIPSDLTQEQRFRVLDHIGSCKACDLLLKNAPPISKEDQELMEDLARQDSPDWERRKKQ